MRHTVAAALLALSGSLAAAPPAQAEPTVATLVLDVTYGCFGCGEYGPAGNEITGTVAGEGAFTADDTVTGSFTNAEPTGTTCVVSGSASGELRSSSGYTAPFRWTRSGSGVVADIDGVPATGTFTIVSPVGNPCGGVAQAKIVLTMAGDVQHRFPRARGHVTIHRFPGTGPILLGHPVAQNGRPWSCRDIRSGASVSQGAVLASPNPGVECLPPSGYNPECVKAGAGGYFAAHSTAGSIDTTARCGSAAHTVHIATGAADAQVRPVNGSLPMRCEITESLTDPATTDYWTFCQVNM